MTARGAARIRARHPWVFRQDVARGPESDAAGAGPSLVAVEDPRGRRLGTATWAAHARLALRMVDVEGSTNAGRVITPGGTAAIVALVQARLPAACARRETVATDRDAYRVCHAEADALPGLFIDRYADVAVLQTASIAMDAARVELAALVREHLSVRAVIARDDGSMRDFEGLPRLPPAILDGGGPTRVVYRLGPNLLEADLLTDGKTGGFLDQADNHQTVAALAPRGARGLDAFAYHGGFALALARRGGAVLATDEDPAAVARLTANAARNGLARLEARPANAFDLLRDAEARGARFDVVVLDPPALAKRGGTAGDAAQRRMILDGADRAYKEIILRGLRLAAPGGLVVACSCSGRVTRAHWDEMCAAAAADSGRAVQVVARLGAGRDHPELVGVPETGHLKCWILRAL